MAKLEDIVRDAKVLGLDDEGEVTVIDVRWHGESALDVTYRTCANMLGNRILLRSDEERVELADAKAPKFTANAEDVKLVSEAYRIHLAHIFDPYLAVHTSEVEPLPHQISAVYEEMLPRLPLRYVLADDPGSGKTIMTGLLLKELIKRCALTRCLIVTPGSLSEQWQDELFRKFHLKFDILTNESADSCVTGNVFTEMSFCIARLDKLSRSEHLQNLLKEVSWDLVVCDEAHKMSASYWGNELKYTKRFKLGMLLSERARHFLLLTATPHNGKEKDFRAFMTLIDRDRFEGAARSLNIKIDVSDVMRRLVKEDLLKFDGKPLFPERRSSTISYALTLAESELYREVTEYVRNEFNRADNLDGSRRSAVGFALTILQRRLASSPEAIYQSLKRRRERLEKRLEEARLDAYYDDADILPDDDFDSDDYAPDELESAEEDIACRASAARTLEELEAEISSLSVLETHALRLRQAGTDRKWEEVSRLFQDDKCMFTADGKREKLIIFTEHRDTLLYLRGKIANLLGSYDPVAIIHGGMNRVERHKAEEGFRQDKDKLVLIATDAAGEGINLQRAHLMINYDLPWNPNRLEQRFGRIHRIGQKHVCYLWNLVASGTREGDVFKRLFEKLEAERKALGGKVFDILGSLDFGSRPLRDLLIEAIRYGDDKETCRRLERDVENALDIDKLRSLIEKNALTDDVMDVSRVMEIRAEMERMEAHKLQPHFVANFFKAAFERLGGKIFQREEGLFEITRVPQRVKNRAHGVVADKYERICFNKDYRHSGEHHAEFLYPGHALVDSVTDLIWEDLGKSLRSGAIFADDNDYGDKARVLFYIDESIADGTKQQDGQNRVVSRKIHFVEMDSEGHVSNAGYAPYLDYCSLNEEDEKVVREALLNNGDLFADLENKAVNYAVDNIIPEHLEEIRKLKLERLDKIEKAVRERLSAEIQFLDTRALEVTEKEKNGEDMRLVRANFRKRADELEERLKSRLAEISKERNMFAKSPHVVSCSLVIPKGLLHKLLPLSHPLADEEIADRKAVEYAAMKAVMDIERRLGYMPKDVSAQKCGYDIESEIPPSMRNGGYCYRFIEVKGRRKGADSVTITKNEILTGKTNINNFILAIVEVDGEHTETVYLRGTFGGPFDTRASRSEYAIKDLIDTSEIIYSE